MTRAVVLARVERELLAAEEALQQGKPGRARAAARRAAGFALEGWASRRTAHHPRPDWPREALARLQMAQSDPALPPAVQEAVHQLTLTVPAEYDAIERADPEDRAEIERRIAIINRKEHVAREDSLLAAARVVADWVAGQMP